MFVHVLSPVTDDSSTLRPPFPDDAQLASAALNEFGEFRLPPLTAGEWRLTLELADKTIELPLLVLPPGAALR